MNKSVIISIQPKWCELIASDKKTIEVRKSRPKIETPIKCYIYCSTDKKPKMLGCYDTKNKRVGRTFPCNVETAHALGFQIVSGKVIGEFVCDYIEEYDYDPQFGYYTDGYYSSQDDLPSMCLTQKDLINYGKGKTLYGWHISDLVIYDEPKELGEFSRFGYIERGCACVNSSCKYHHDNGYYEPPHCELYGSGNCSLERPPQSWGYVKEL